MSDTQRLASKFGMPQHEVRARLEVVAGSSADVQFGRRKRKPYVATPPPKSERKQED